RHALAVGRGAQDPETVAQPLDGGSRDEDAAFERVRGPSIEPPRDGREQSMARSHGSMTGVEQQKATGAIRVLGVTGDIARLAEQGRLVVAGHAGDRDAVGQPAKPARLAEDTRG